MKEKSSLLDHFFQYYLGWFLRLSGLLLGGYMIQYAWKMLHDDFWYLEEQSFFTFSIAIIFGTILLGTFHFWHDEIFKERTLTKMFSQLNKDYPQAEIRKIEDRIWIDLEGNELSLQPQLFLFNGRYIEIGIRVDISEEKLPNFVRRDRKYELRINEGYWQIRSKYYLPYFSSDLPSKDELELHISNLLQQLKAKENSLLRT